MSQLSPSQLIELPKCMESLNDEEKHFMGRTISPVANDYPLSKNDSSSNKKFNHSHRSFQISQRLLTQILDHASRSRGQFSTVPVKPKPNQKNKLLLPYRNETSNP
ncbi:hypothetical protein O181_073655 [Austropuccinia psidii MF-1]|uniref:Uncharacterized protein n=1 Tax=Austropuccinia psidii MF-1 TaxID=1389203 RepID=A0A9Q3F2Z2_9BASI|nr:hypothetical protein [Austropuccinia psidii MF-1]